MVGYGHHRCLRYRYHYHHCWAHIAAGASDLQNELSNFLIAFSYHGYKFCSQKYATLQPDTPCICGIVYPARIIKSGLCRRHIHLNKKIIFTFLKAKEGKWRLCVMVVTCQNILLTLCRNYEQLQCWIQSYWKSTYPMIKVPKAMFDMIGKWEHDIYLLIHRFIHHISRWNQKIIACFAEAWVVKTHMCPIKIAFVGNNDAF